MERIPGFLRYTVSWISQNLAIPFWTLGHVHLSINSNVLHDLHIILASIGMNLIVAVGFFLDYKKQVKEEQ